MTRVVIGLGSNLGDRHKNLALAVGELGFIDKTSSIIQTKALLLSDSPPEWDIKYLNQVASGDFDGTPLELLTLLKQVEVKLGRPENHLRYSPRIIDLDILIFGDLRIEETNLKIPHPEFWNRDFCHKLAYEIEPKLVEVARLSKSH